LLLDPTDEHKKALAAHMGFRSHGSGRGYLVVKADGQLGREYHRIIEARDSKITVSTTTETIEGDESGASKTLVSRDLSRDEEQTHLLSDAEIDRFLDALAVAPEQAASGISVEELGLF